MRRVESYPWSELVPGAYVEDATGLKWKLVEEHPEQRGVFKAHNAAGELTILRDPGKPVVAYVPTEDEALAYLHRILGARAVEGQIVVDALPTQDSAGARRRIASHLKIMHGEYTEPRMKFTDLVACHELSHARADYDFPHIHKETVS